MLRSDRGACGTTADGSRRRERIGTPLDGEAFLEKLESLVGGALVRRKPGLKRLEGDNWVWCSAGFAEGRAECDERGFGGVLCLPV